MGKPHLRCNGLNASCSRGYVSPARTLFLLRSPLLFQLFLPSLARSSTTFRSATIFLFLSRFCLFFLSFSFFPRSDTNQNPPFNPIRPRRVAAARVMIRKNVERRACFSKGKKRGGGKKWEIRPLDSRNFECFSSRECVYVLQSRRYLSIYFYLRP